MNKLVSILICTYNTEKTIQWTLKSILNQTYENYELLILDNNSKDNTLEILNNYKNDNKRIKIFNEWKNLWAYWWLNYLLDNAEWEYIAIQDHDDVRHPTKLEEQVKFLEKNTEFVWCWTTCLMYYWISKVWFLVDTEEKETNNVTHTSLMFRNLWYRYDSSDIYLCDVDFMKRILSDYKNKLYIIWKPLTLHYIKENGGNYSDIWFSITRKNFKKYLNLIWNDPYHICCLLFSVFCQLLPKKIKNKIMPWWFLKKMSRVKPYYELKNEYVDDMIKFIN